MKFAKCIPKMKDETKRKKTADKRKNIENTQCNYSIA